MSQAERIAAARRNLILDAPFFGSLLMRLKMVRDDSRNTFCTDGKVIRYNEAFCASLPDLQVRGVLAHEVAHVALGHLWRIGNRKLEKWNIAADYAINRMLVSYAEECEAQGHPVPWVLPPCGLLDPAFTGKATEEIYNLLPDEDESDGGGSGVPGPGDFEAPAAESSEEQGSEDDWKIAVVQAATVAKMQGRCPGSVRRLVDELVSPKIPWQETLREFIRVQAREDYSWSRPARRYAHAGVILPGLHSERMGKIVVAVDTSGSIDAEILRQFTSEMQAILDGTKPEGLTVIYCDAKVQHVSQYEYGDAIRFDEAKGGGGTDFRPVFDYIARQDIEITACVYLTDGFGSHASNSPDYPVLWALTGMGASYSTFPFGEVLSLQ